MENVVKTFEVKYGETVQCGRSIDRSAVIAMTEIQWKTDIRKISSSNQTWLGNPHKSMEVLMIPGKLWENQHHNPLKMSC
jgi:hypothetical protein